MSMRIIVNALAVALPCAVIGVTADLFLKADLSIESCWHPIIHSRNGDRSNSCGV